MNTKNILFAFGIGLTVGAGVALLYAPQSGVATRKKIKRSAEDASDYLEDTAEYLKEQADHISSEAEKFLKKLAPPSMMLWTRQGASSPEP